MEDKIQMLAKELGAGITYGEMDAPGHVIFPPALNYKPLICINSKLPDNFQDIVIVHELGHIAKQRGDRVLYERTINMKLKMEKEANVFLIKYEIQKWIDYGEEFHNFNYLDFMKQNDIPSCEENIVKETLSKFFAKVG